MYPLILNNRNIIIYWSYKCGCSFIRDYYYNILLQKNYSINFIKILSLINILINYFLNFFFKIPNESVDLIEKNLFNYYYNKYLFEFFLNKCNLINGKNNIYNQNKNKIYTSIYICRNPYSRLVSCFIDKYINGYCSLFFIINIYLNNLLKNERKQVTFNNFVNLLYDKYVLKKFSFIESIYTENQINKNIKLDKIFKLEELNSNKNFFDLFNINLPKNNKKFPYYINYNNNNFNKNIYDVEYKELVIMKKKNLLPNFNFFYNKDIEWKVNEIYKLDFKTFEIYNIFYNL